MKLYRKADYFNYTGTEDESMKKCFWTELKKAFGREFWTGRAGYFLFAASYTGDIGICLVIS